MAKYPKTVLNGFLRKTDDDYKQINLHLGTTKWYWFIQPHENPFITNPYETPNEVQMDAEKHLIFHLFRKKSFFNSIHKDIRLTGLSEVNTYLREKKYK